LISISSRSGLAEQVAQPRGDPTELGRVEDGAAPPPVEQCAACQLGGHLGGFLGGERGQADGDVGEGFRGRSAEPEQQDRAEDRIAAGSEDQVHPGRRHGLDQVSGRADGLEAAEGLVEIGRGGDAEVDAADVGLVQHVGVEDLHRNRAAEFGEGGAGLSAIGTGSAGRSGDRDPVEQRFRLVFVVRTCHTGGHLFRDACGGEP